VSTEGLNTADGQNTPVCPHCVTENSAFVWNPFSVLVLRYFVN